MAEQRPFSRFRLPWLTARPAPEPQIAPRPNVETIQAPVRPTPRPPFLSPPQSRAPSPPRATTESQVVVQQTTQTGATSVPSSPSRVASQPVSPPKKLQSATQESSKPSIISTQPLLSAPKQEPKPTVSLLMSQTSSQPSSPSTRTTKMQSTVSQPSAQETSKTAQTQTDLKPLSEPTEKMKETGKAKEVAEKLKTTIPYEQRQQEDKKTTMSSSGEHIKTVSSTHATTKNKLTESYQKSNGEQVSLQKQIRDDIFKFVHKLGVSQLKYPMEEKPVTIVTIAGENRGGSMHVTAEPVTKDGSIHIHRGYKTNPDETTTDGEVSTKKRKSKTRQEPAKKAYLNSNAQGINNSMIFDTSVNERSPGIQLSLSNNVVEPTKPSAKPETIESHKAEFNVTPAQKLTYEPTIRRRCLRGLFLESSDSDPDNPDKPRRHGCRYYCGDKSKDKDVDVF
ncbi:hypothetical protein JCGZ_04445 [Jatropha curcas]|uniref:Uncharacterized protein n=1 Tax=Jatropha curcas TaxID=180498 RepID=A0A067L200_JATCU|nr:proteoglycan 4 [Jatropha curcas]KDP38520.1 hypothetical protein JCGZ_04445 [Jatropha curcas]